MSEVDLLQNLILSNPYVKVNDHNVVVSVCSKLPIESDPGHINEYLRLQINAEAGAVYLTGKYLNIAAILEDRLEEKESEVCIGLGDTSEGGYKLTKADKKSQLLFNPEYFTLRTQLRGIKSLVVLLERLSMVVFRRQPKLEQLSVNYRRETEADKRHGFD